MPVDYRINSNHELVVCQASGRVLVDDLVAYTRRLSSDAAFNPLHNQLFCFLAIDASGLTTMDMRRMAQTSIFNPGTRRAFVCPPGLTFGLGRAFASYIAEIGQDVSIVESRAEGAAAFGLEEGAIDWPG